MSLPMILATPFPTYYLVRMHSSEEPKSKLPVKVAPSLAKELEKLDMNERAEKEKKGMRCHSAKC